MAIFNFLDFNHCPQGKIIIQDITRTMGHQLMALGHQVMFTDCFIGRGTGFTFVLESFADDPRTMDQLAWAHSKDYPIIIVATEEPTPTGFNHGLEPAMVDRQNAFAEAAKYCDGILHLMPGDHVNAWYSQHAPSAYAELGFAPSLVSIDATEPDYDFGFYGKMTWRREQILGELERRGGKVLTITSLDVPQAERDAHMRRARVIVQIRGNEEWGMVSSTRCASALHMGRPVVAEPHALCMNWDKVVMFSKTTDGLLDGFYHTAFSVAQYWDQFYVGQLAKFKEHFTPEFCIGEPLRKIGAL